MAINTTPGTPEAFHPYPDSASTAPYAGTADAGDFFSTLLDIVNPLQHIPVISHLYREITGNEISQTAQIVGGGLFGGPIGLASASANAILEQASGDDLMGHTLAMFSGDDTPGLQHAGEAQIHQQAEATPKDTIADEIVWPGPPALARLTPKPAPPAAAPVVDRAASSETPQNAVPDAATTDATETEAFLNALPATWVNEALRDAETVNQALQTGAPAELGGPRPWVGNAILDALAKY